MFPSISKLPSVPVNLRKLRLEATPAERELCGRDIIVARNLEIARANLQRYQEFWPGFAGGIIEAVGEIGSVPGRFMERYNLLHQARFTPKCLHDSTNGSEDYNSPRCNDLEFMIAPMLQVTTNYLLPITFGFLGSLLYVLLDHFTKLRTNTLSPRDFPLMFLRLIIGLVVAACVSLLVSSSATPGAMAAGSMSGAPIAGALVASLVSSASGITFLAGFGAEAVVTPLQSLVTRLFTTPA